LQDIDDESLWDFLFSTYKYLLLKYQQDRELIDPRNLVEIKYELLISDPHETLKELHQILFPELEPDEVKMKGNLNLHKDHTIKKYKFERKYIDRVNRELGDLITQQGYAIL
jgi:hypothetical protein